MDKELLKEYKEEIKNKNSSRNRRWMTFLFGILIGIAISIFLNMGKTLINFVNDTASRFIDDKGSNEQDEVKTKPKVNIENQDNDNVTATTTDIKNLLEDDFNTEQTRRRKKTQEKISDDKAVEQKSEKENLKNEFLPHSSTPLKNITIKKEKIIETSDLNKDLYTIRILKTYDLARFNKTKAILEKNNIAINIKQLYSKKNLYDLDFGVYDSLSKLNDDSQKLTKAGFKNSQIRIDETEKFTLRLGRFETISSAKKFALDLKKKGVDAIIKHSIRQTKEFYIYHGNFRSKEDAKKKTDKLRKLNLKYETIEKVR